MDGWRRTLKSCGRESMTVSGNCGNDFLQFEVITDEAVVLCPYGERCLWSTCFFPGPSRTTKLSDPSLQQGGGTTASGEMKLPCGRKGNEEELCAGAASTHSMHKAQ